MVSITTWLVTSLFAFIVGIIAGRIVGKEKCREKVMAIVEEYGFKDDDNAGDA